MSLDYSNTCPIIDQALEDYHANITSSIKEYLTTRVPDTELWEDYECLSQDMYTDFEQEAETLRSTNVDMREAADKQLEELEDEIAELKSEVDYLTGRVDFLETRESELLQETLDLTQ